MTRIAQAARITLKGFRAGTVTSSSPIESQCELVYQAAKHYATTHNFASYKHRDVYGYRGDMVMSQIVRSLFPDLEGDEFKIRSSVINQVLRRTDAAVCLAQPGPDSGKLPTWFVAASMPANITVVALNLGGKSASAHAGTPAVQPTPATRAESRLTPHEAGEDLEPGKVTVTQKTETATATKKLTKQESLERAREVNRKQREDFQTRVPAQLLEEIQTSPVPLTTRELLTLVAPKNDDDSTVHITTLRHILNRLVSTGKLVSRMETFEERLLRGGGNNPSGPEARLYASPPGPVPMRTELPNGISPVITPVTRIKHNVKADSTESSPSKSAQYQDEVIKYLTVRGARFSQIWDHFANLGLTNPGLLMNVIEALVRSGDLYKGENKHYYLTVKRRGPRPATELPAENLTGVVSPPETPAAAAGPLDKLIELAESLVVSAETTDSEELAALREEREKIALECIRLRNELAAAQEKIRKQAAAIAALTS